MLFFYGGHVLNVYSNHLANGITPAFVTFSCVIKQCAESGILCHNKFAACAQNKIFFNIKPFVNLFKVFGLMSFNPFIFPNRVFNGRAYRARVSEVFKQLCNLRTGNLHTVGNAFFELFSCSLVHICHGSANAITLFVNKHKPLHCRAKADALYHFFGNVGRFA